MTLLLDTHALIWWLADDPQLTPAACAEIADSDVFVSAVSAMEICTKVRIGKLPSAKRLAERFEEKILAEGFKLLPLTVRHGQRAGSFPDVHKDPFDRMLIAQALLENLTIVSNETMFDRFGVSRLW
ncbi:type II toxin-antitoxin system VapC family toxin [Sandaracinobacteroides saxicola]|uniref:Type II toxin-antitoxin system VapC family toxin n=1 Tax=Sandaracinobacteroides saxicola TaxID=2759707 RepID=A0A7G5IF73_9SPHN|nr:type II toxin-antitoxin system VapC family toxin [Sandaracinobacteroides saxicola]QMW22015.1 type II toxin-antitoxin system VapC family toxin [Sandaracinobacteroides saxicola]